MDGEKSVAIVVEGEDIAALNLVDPGMDSEVAADETRGDRRQGVEVPDLHEHVFPNCRPNKSIAFEVAVVLAHDPPYLLGVLKPATDGRQPLDLPWIESPFDRTAMGVAADDDVADPETVDRVLDRRLLARWDAVGWYDVACVAEHEQVAQLGLGQHRGVDPGIGASDKQRVRALAAHQALEVAASRCEDIALESPDTFY
jgi:hypothetical protein